jgi:hypothetical protein
MAIDLLLVCGEGDETLGGELEAALDAAGFRVRRQSGTLRAVPARLAVLVVTRAWAGSPGLNDAIDAASTHGLPTLLAWWHEDAPSDALSRHAGEDEVFYACFLPRPQRIAGLVERVRVELA